MHSLRRRDLAAVAGILFLVVWPQAAVAQLGWLTDPFRSSNWKAVEADFMAWVEKVEQGHLASVKAGEAAAEYKELKNVLLNAENILVVGAGGYEKVQEAVDAAPEGARTVIQIYAGNYR